jgi:hypothetical protein
MEGEGLSGRVLGLYIQLLEPSRCSVSPIFETKNGLEEGEMRGSQAVLATCRVCAVFASNEAGLSRMK